MSTTRGASFAGPTPLPDGRQAQHQEVSATCESSKASAAAGLVISPLSTPETPWWSFELPHAFLLINDAGQERRTSRPRPGSKLHRGSGPRPEAEHPEASVAMKRGRCLKLAMDELDAPLSKLCMPQ